MQLELQRKERMRQRMFHYASSVPHSFPLPQDVKEMSGETQRMIRGQLLWSSRRAERLMQCKGGALLTFQMELAALRSICSPPLTPRPNEFRFHNEAKASVSHLKFGTHAFITKLRLDESLLVVPSLRSTAMCRQLSRPLRCRSASSHSICIDWKVENG